MKISGLIGLALIFSIPAHGQTIAIEEQAPADQALPALTQRLYDALAPGERDIWQRCLSERFEQTDESGARLDKKQFMAAFGPLPAGLSGHIEVHDAKVDSFGNYAFLRYDMDEQERVFDQNLHVLYRATDAWRREQGRWRMISSNVMTLAQDPPPLPVAPSKLADYPAIYTVSNQWRYQVSLKDEELVFGREGHTQTPMLALAADIFVLKGNPLGTLYIFQRSADGRVTGIVERRKFANLAFVRVPEPVK